MEDRAKNKMKKETWRIWSDLSEFEDSEHKLKVARYTKDMNTGKLLSKLYGYKANQVHPQSFIIRDSIHILRLTN